MKRWAAGWLAAAAALFWWSGLAQAYRPFDGTDAAVAEPNQVEIELAPAGFLREGQERTLLAPAGVFNYGLSPNWEAVLQGEIAHGLAGSVGGTSLTGAGAFLKGVLREGSLQQKEGPSLATEFGLLLPGIRADRGTGASIAGILSQQWPWASVHLNASAALTRQQHADLFAGLIVEGPHDWPLRPVAETFYERDFGEAETRSLLLGVVWQAKEEVAVDFAVRGAFVNQHTAGEIRVGITFALQP